MKRIVLSGFDMQIVTYKYRLKDRRAAKVLRGHAFQVNQYWNWCVAQHRDASC